MLDHRGSSLKPRLPDNTQNYLIKVHPPLYRILDLGLMKVKRWAKECIMQLPSTKTKLTTNFILDLDYQRLPEGQQLTLVLPHTILLFFKISTWQVGIPWQKMKTVKYGPLTNLLDLLSSISTWSTLLLPDNSKYIVNQWSIFIIRLTGSLYIWNIIYSINSIFIANHSHVGIFLVHNGYLLQASSKLSKFLLQYIWTLSLSQFVFVVVLLTTFNDEIFNTQLLKHIDWLLMLFTLGSFSSLLGYCIKRSLILDIVSE